MRENRTCGSEGGEPGNRASLPLSSVTQLSMFVARNDGSFFLEWGQCFLGAGLS